MNEEDKHHWSWMHNDDGVWERNHHHAHDCSDSIDAGDGNDIVYGQDGQDSLQGGAGNDWLIGGGGDGSGKDLLNGGAGINKLYQGENNSKQLSDLVKAAMPSWSTAFSNAGLPIVLFSSNTQIATSHSNLASFDALELAALPWEAIHLVANQAAKDGGIAITPSAAMVGALVAQAKQLWLATGLADATALDSIQVNIADLGGKDQLLLGETQGSVITLDDNSAGWDWFADPTPGQSEEYQLMPDGSLQARPGSDASGRMDMLTVISHKKGHVLGFEHTDAVNEQAELMDAALAAGVRELPAASTKVSFFDVNSGSFLKADQPLAPAATDDQDGFMVVMDADLNQPRNELYQLKPADDKRDASVAPVILSDESDSLVSRLKTRAVWRYGKK